MKNFLRFFLVAGICFGVVVNFSFFLLVDSVGTESIFLHGQEKFAETMNGVIVIAFIMSMLMSSMIKSVKSASFLKGKIGPKFLGFVIIASFLIKEILIRISAFDAAAVYTLFHYFVTCLALIWIVRALYFNYKEVFSKETTV